MGDILLATVLRLNLYVLGGCPKLTDVQVSWVIIPPNFSSSQHQMAQPKVTATTPRWFWLR